ncbi:hypothetical protein [Niabella hibiscisoli]|uniref:hypothetical protein n=1 Tax=Niabella hibiscisoli TaxID=1825928 RepID=UPI001F0E34E0|nr:hypothetical protein [Niabella hibiscisoli]MCH5718547.1 hypothetical protein [Niabella hibiscisoli]
MKKLALYFCCITPALYLINCKQKSLNFSISKTTDSIRTSPFYKKALSYKYIKNDSSFYYFNEIASNSKDSLEIAMAYNEMAILQNDAGDYFGSEESLLASLKSLNEKNGLHYPCLFQIIMNLALSI